jgi:hypothetical protein
MPRSSKPAWQTLTWHKARRQWKKFREGKTYYLGDSGLNKSDRTGHDRALSEWREIEDRLTHDANDAAEQQRRERLAEENADLHLGVRLARGEQVPGIDRILQGDLVLERQLLKIAAQAAGVADEPDFALDGSDNGDDGTTIDVAIAQFLTSFRSDVKLGSKSRSRHKALRAHLSRFADWQQDGKPRLGGQPAASINEQTLTGFRSHLIDLIAAGEIAHITARDVLMAVRQFIRRAYEENVIARPPRNLDSRHLAINVPARKPKHLTLGQIKTLLAGASDRTKLYLELSLNIGGTQIDIADLAPDELDLKKGTIRRKRSKTRGHEGAPEVEYKLWPSVIDGLMKHRTRKGNHVLTNEQGQPLIREELLPGGKLWRVDNIGTAYRRLVVKVNKAAVKAAAEAGNDALPEILPHFKLLRATAANMIEQHPQYKPVAGLYLAHAPGTVRERFYTAADQRLLAEALQWLGKTLGIVQSGD